MIARSITNGQPRSYVCLCCVYYVHVSLMLKFMEYRTGILSVELSQGDFPLRCRVALKVAKGEEEGEQGKRRKECVCVSYRERVGRKSLANRSRKFGWTRASVADLGADAAAVSR